MDLCCGDGDLVKAELKPLPNNLCYLDCNYNEVLSGGDIKVEKKVEFVLHEDGKKLKFFVERLTAIKQESEQELKSELLEPPICDEGWEEVDQKTRADTETKDDMGSGKSDEQAKPEKTYFRNPQLIVEISSQEEQAEPDKTYLKNTQDITEESPEQDQPEKTSLRNPLNIVEASLQDEQINPENSSPRSPQHITEASLQDEQANPEKSSTNPPEITEASSKQDQPGESSSRNPQDSASEASEETTKRLQCEKCEKSYKQIGHLMRHMRSAHDEKGMYDCTVCWKSFSRADVFKRHLSWHEERDVLGKPCPTKPYKCPECGKGFWGSQNVTRHVRLTHQGEKNFKCSKCSKSFTQSGGLTRHMLTHNEKSLKCETCGKMFARRFVLRRHELTHTDDKPYKCFVCSRSFIRPSQLSDHVWQHRKDGNYTFQALGL